MVYLVILIAVCAGVLFGIAHQLFATWNADGWTGRVVKLVLLMAWVWASWRLISRNLAKKK